MNPETSLKQNSDFRAVYTRGKSAVSPRAVLYCRKNRRDRNRVGFTVSRKLGNAVMRNRVRRRLREIMRLHAGELRQGWDLILVARTRAVNADYGKLEEDVLRCMSQLHLLKKDGEE